MTTGRKVLIGKASTGLLPDQILTGEGKVMICSRCGSRCPPRKEGLCFHCQVAKELGKAAGKTLLEAGIAENFPEWEKPKKGDRLATEIFKVYPT